MTNKNVLKEVNVVYSIVRYRATEDVAVDVSLPGWFP